MMVDKDGFTDQFTGAITDLFSTVLNSRIAVKIIEAGEESLLQISNDLDLKAEESRWKLWCAGNATFVEFLKEFHNAKDIEIKADTYVVEAKNTKEAKDPENS